MAAEEKYEKSIIEEITSAIMDELFSKLKLYIEQDDIRVILDRKAKSAAGANFAGNQIILNPDASDYIDLWYERDLAIALSHEYGHCLDRRKTNELEWQESIRLRKVFNTQVKKVCSTLVRSLSNQAFQSVIAAEQRAWNYGEEIFRTLVTNDHSLLSRFEKQRDGCMATYLQWAAAVKLG